MRFNIQDERKVHSVLHVFTYVYLKGEWSLGKRCCDSTPLPGGIYWNQGDLQGAVKIFAWKPTSFQWF